MLLTKKDIHKIIKSVAQKLREKGDGASKVVPQLERHKEKYLDILSQPYELSQDEITRLDNIYKNVPDEVIFRKVKMIASEHLHAIMTLDLNKLLVIQLDKNVNEIHEDKIQLERALSELETLSISLNDVVKSPECLKFTSWQGADLLVIDVNETSSKENNPSWTVVKTAFPNEVSYVISKSFSICNHFLDYMSKYYFTQKLGNATNEYKGDDLVELLKCVIESAKESIRQFHQNYVTSKNERLIDRRIQMVG